MQSTSSSFGENISAPASKKDDQGSHALNVDSPNSEQRSNSIQDEDMDVPDVVEEIIEMLLSGLRDTVCLKGEDLL